MTIFLTSLLWTLLHPLIKRKENSQHLPRRNKMREKKLMTAMTRKKRMTMEMLPMPRRKRTKRVMRKRLMKSLKRKTKSPKRTMMKRETQMSRRAMMRKGKVTMNKMRRKRKRK